MTENNKNTVSSSSVEIFKMIPDQIQDSAAEHRKRNEAQKRLLAIRERMLKINPMSMEEIDRIIHNKT